jgi:NAD(P)-dependent dehydrogenase (short-subunit alcohol dehydrogenase family)
MNPNFQDKVAVVTGAGGTLCSAIAKHLATLGCKVVLVGRTREKLEKVAEDIVGLAPGAPAPLIAPCDVTDEAAINALAERVLSELGPCRFLINGAGGNNPAAMPTRLRFSEADLAANAKAGAEEQPPLAADRGFFDISMEAFRSVLEINTLGTVIPSRAFGLQMARAGGGAILNFASMNTYRPLTRVAPYAMAKAAIANWTQFFAQYMAPARVRVNAVAPGFMVNERSRKYLCTPDGGLSPRGEQVMAHTPMGRFGEAEDLLGCVEWLLDDTRAAFVTGITVPVDGGFLASAGV